MFNLVAIALMAGLVWLHYNSATKSRDLLEQGETARQRSQQLARLRSLVERTADDRRELEEHFINQDSLPTFIEKLESLETSNQINLDLVSVEAVSEPQPLIKFNLSLTGSQSKLLAFIKDLEALPYQLRLQSGKLQTVTTEESGLTWTSELVLELLSYQPEPKIEVKKQNGTE